FNNMSRARIEYSVANPDILYMLVYNFGYKVLKSTDGGDNWTQTTSINIGSFGNLLSVKPDDPDFVLAGLVVLHLSQNGGGQWDYFTWSGVDYWDLVFDP